MRKGTEDLEGHAWQNDPLKWVKGMKLIQKGRCFSDSFKAISGMSSTCTLEPLSLSVPTSIASVLQSFHDDHGKA